MTEGERGSGPLSALRERDFRNYWFAQALSGVGTQGTGIALSLVVVDVARTTTAVTTVPFVGSLPLLALLLFGGAIADKFDRRRILLVASLLQCALMLGLASLVGTHRITMAWIYVIVMADYLVAAFSGPAESALVPSLVPAEKVGPAVSLSTATFHILRFLGPAIAVLIIAATSRAVVFAVDAASFLPLVLVLPFITVKAAPAKEKARPAGGYLTRIREGLTFARRHPLVFSLLGLTTFSGLFVFSFLSVFLVVVNKHLVGGTDTSFGLLESVSGIAAFLGVTAQLGLTARWRGRALIAGVATVGALLVAIAFVRSVILLACLVGLLTFVFASINVMRITMIQIAVPDELRGRVSSLNALMRQTWPLAGVLLGELADHVGMRATLAGMGATYALFMVPWLIRGGAWNVHRDSERTGA